MLSRRLTTMAMNCRSMVFAQAPTRTFVRGDLSEKKSVEEKSYFSKNDAKLLKNLVLKMEKREKLDNSKKELHDAICDDLDDIFNEHGLDKTETHQLLYQELIEWKRHSHE
jgi:hypothetical protein